MIDRMKRPLALGAIALAALTVLAPPALAGNQGPTVSLGFGGTLEYLRTRSPNVITQGGPITSCTSGDFVVGGGASILGSGATSHLNTSARFTSAGEAWLAEGRASGINGRTVTGWAICGGTEPTQTSSTDTLDPGTSFNAPLSCPSGQSRLSGGIEGDGGDILINGMFPSDTGGWVSSSQNAGSLQATARSFLLCADVRQRFRPESEVVEPKRAGTVIASCPENQVVVGGGVRATRSGVWQQDVSAVATRPWDSPEDADKTPEDGWYIKSYNGTSQRISLTAYASCLRL